MGSIGLQPAQALGLGPVALAVLDDLRLRLAVLAQQPVQRAEPFLESLAIERVALEIRDGGVDLGRRRPGCPPRSPRAVGPAPRTGRPAVASSVAARTARPTWSREPPSPTRTSCASPAEPRQSFGVGCGTKARAQLVDLARAQAGRFDLGRGVVGQLQPSLDLARIDLQLAQRRVVLAPRPDRDRDFFAECPESAVRVEELALRDGVQQALLIVLAVDLDERRDGSRQAATP